MAVREARRLTAVDLDAVADELYGLPLGAFTPTRTARAKEAKAAGDRDLAAAITALAKPTKVAWLVNQLVRQRPDDVEPLLALGAGLREATATLSGDDLRTLTRQQHQLVHAIVETARGIAAEAGEPVSQDVADGVDATLRAALADDELATALSAGRLTDKLEFAGFGGGATKATVPPATRRKPVVSKDTAAAERQARIDKADAATAEARTALEEAQAARDSAQATADQAATTTDEAEQRIVELREELEAATTAHTEAVTAAKAARSAVDLADRSVRGALRRLDTAQAERAKL